MSGETAKVIRFPVERRQPPCLIGLPELQKHFGFSERWWRYRIAERDFPTHRYGGRLRFDLQEVDDWLREHYAA